MAFRTKARVFLFEGAACARGAARIRARCGAQKKEGRSDRERSERPLSGAAWGGRASGFQYQIFGGGGGEGTGLAGGGRMHCRTRPAPRSFPRVSIRDAVVVSVMIVGPPLSAPEPAISAREQKHGAAAAAVLWHFAQPRDFARGGAARADDRAGGKKRPLRGEIRAAQNPGAGEVLHLAAPARNDAGRDSPASPS